MKIYILLADGFEECEALVPADLLMRAGAQVVLTGLDFEEGRVGSGCLSGEGGALSLHRRIDRYYPGTGDLFASVMLGALLNGAKLAEACDRAGEFVKDCIAYTAAQQTDPMHGVQFEKLLHQLIEGGNQTGTGIAGDH